MISILYSNKSFGGAEIYVRKLSSDFNIPYYTIKNNSLFFLLKLCVSEKSIVFHDLRASLFKLTRPFNKDKIIIHGPGKYPKLLKILIYIFSFTKCEIIMVSEDLYNQYKKFNKIKLLENTSSFNNVTLKFNSLDFIYFGRLEESKGIKKLVDFWIEKKIMKKLHLVGDGSLYNYIKNQNHKNIILYGPLNQQEIIEIIEENCAYYISLSFREGLSLSLLEALSCGLIPIVANIPTQEFIKKDYEFELVKKDLSNLEMLVNSDESKNSLINMCKNTQITFQKFNLKNNFTKYWKQEKK